MLIILKCQQEINLPVADEREAAFQGSELVMGPIVRVCKWSEVWSRLRAVMSYCSVVASGCGVMTCSRR